MVWFKYRTVVDVTSNNNNNKKIQYVYVETRNVFLFHAISFDTPQGNISFGYTCMCLYLNISAKN